MNIKNIQLLIEFIEKTETGNPAELAAKLGVSERMIYKYLDILKSEFNVPIKYNHSKKTYFFSETGSIDLRWQENDNQKKTK
jgi:predicted DNA-binding transcriptional regulator YafY